VNHFFEEAMKGISLFIFKSFDSLRWIDANRFMFWLFMYALVVLAVYRLFKRGALFFAGLNLSVFLILVAVSILFFPKDHEMLYAAGTCLALFVFLFFFLLLLWIPIRLQYDPKAEEKIQLLLMQGPLNDEDLNHMYRLKARSREAYESNVKWLLNSKPKKNKEI